MTESDDDPSMNELSDEELDRADSMLFVDDGLIGIATKDPEMLLTPDMARVWVKDLCEAISVAESQEGEGE